MLLLCGVSNICHGFYYDVQLFSKIFFIKQQKVFWKKLIVVDTIHSWA